MHSLPEFKFFFSLKKSNGVEPCWLLFDQLSTYLCSNILFSGSTRICFRLVGDPLLLSFTEVYVALSSFLIETTGTVRTLHIVCVKNTTKNMLIASQINLAYRLQDKKTVDVPAAYVKINIKLSISFTWINRRGWGWRQRVSSLHGNTDSPGSSDSVDEVLMFGPPITFGGFNFL